MAQTRNLGIDLLIPDPHNERSSNDKEAITRLGTNRVFQMVLCMSVAPLVRKPIKGYDMDPAGLWEHSFGVAVTAEKLVQVLKLNVSCTGSAARPRARSAAGSCL